MPGAGLCCMGNRTHDGLTGDESQFLPASRHSGPRWKKLRSLRDTSFRPAVKAILQSIIMRESRDDGWAWAGRLKIAKDAGICLRQVGRYLPKLQRCGLVEIKRRYNAEPRRRVILEKLELAESSPLALNEKDILPLSRPKREKAIQAQRKGNLGTSERDIQTERKGHLQHTKTVLKTVSEDCSEDYRAFGAARSPTGVRFGGAPSGSLGNKQKEKSFPGGNGMTPVFSQKLLTITEQQDEEIARFIPNIHERDAQYAAFYNSLHSSLGEPVGDVVTAMRTWMQSAPRFFTS